VQLQHRVNRLEPFLGFNGVEVFQLREFCHAVRSSQLRRL
jgi:hypothetical protein